MQKANTLCKADENDEGPRQGADGKRAKVIGSGWYWVETVFTAIGGNSSEMPITVSGQHHLLGASTELLGGAFAAQIGKEASRFKLIREDPDSVYDRARHSPISNETSIGSQGDEIFQRAA